MDAAFDFFMSWIFWIGSGLCIGRRTSLLQPDMNCPSRFQSLLHVIDLLRQRHLRFCAASLSHTPARDQALLSPSHLYINPPLPFLRVFSLDFCPSPRPCILFPAFFPLPPSPLVLPGLVGHHNRQRQHRPPSSHTCFFLRFCRFLFQLSLMYRCISPLLLLFLSLFSRFIITQQQNLNILLIIISVLLNSV